jgi:hypothetical protein
MEITNFFFSCWGNENSDRWKLPTISLWFFSCSGYENTNRGKGPNVSFCSYWEIMVNSEAILP